jgi:hypothetical protein
MKKSRLVFITLITAFIVMISAVVTCSAASSGDCGDHLKWTLDDSGTLTISGEGEMKCNPYSPPFSKNAAIRNVVIESGVTMLLKWSE